MDLEELVCSSKWESSTRKCFKPVLALAQLKG